MKLLLTFLLFSSFASGQDSGGISGTLFNDSCGIIPKAYITISSVDGAYPRGVVSARTDELGSFSIESLPVGTYTISIDLRDKYFHGANYSDFMEFNLVIEANETLMLDELVFEPNYICICDFEIVPYVEPRDPFGRSITFTRDDLRMR